MVLISKCLLGEECRYDGGTCYVPEIKEYFDPEEIVSICPEVTGGLPTPRPCAEIKGGDGEDVLNGKAKVVTTEGEDVTTPYIEGAKKAVQLAKDNNCKLAILKAVSPSCGSKEIYDGSFERILEQGQGVTSFLLREEGIEVINEKELNKLNPDSN